MLVDLIKKVDKFVERYARPDATAGAMKNELLDLVQEAIDHGAEKDQNKISGILVKGIKAFMGGKD